MKKLLFVVHRYYPYAGGSEYNVRNMAEECVRQGHETWVLTDEHMGDQNGVHVTSDRNKAYEKWDMIIVHGSCPTQDFIHVNSAIINKISPIYYLLIQPSDHPLAVYGMQNCTWIGCGTEADFAHVEKHGLTNKMKRFVYGIPNEIGQPGFRRTFGITTPYMFISAGGFWPHKRMHELRDMFIEAMVPNTTLVLMGYDNRHNIMPLKADNVRVFLGTTREHVLAAMAEADLYISYSQAEGYGLVLLEAMLNHCEWVSTNVGGANWLVDPFGGCVTLDTRDQFIQYMKKFKSDSLAKEAISEIVKLNHLSEHSVNSFLHLIGA